MSLLRYPGHMSSGKPKKNQANWKVQIISLSLPCRANYNQKKKNRRAAKKRKCARKTHKNKLRPGSRMSWSVEWVATARWKKWSYKFRLTPCSRWRRLTFALTLGTGPEKSIKSHKPAGQSEKKSRPQSHNYLALSLLPWASSGARYQVYATWRAYVPLMSWRSNKILCIYTGPRF